MGEATDGVRALTRALQILEAFPIGHGVGVVDLAAATGLPKSTVHRVLSTLQRGGYVEREDGASGRYRPGLRLAVLGERAVVGNPLVEALRPVVRRVLAATGETVFCGTVVGDSVLVLDVATSSRPIVPLPAPGSRAPLHASSMGKVILAYRPPPDGFPLWRQHELPRLTPRTITDPAVFGEVLHDVRSQGFAVNEEEEVLGISCVAVPVRDRSGTVVAALSVATPADRMSSTTQDRLAGVLREASLQASRALGWRPVA